MLDPTGTVINWNPGAERIKGYAREEIIGQHFSRFYTERGPAGRRPQESAGDGCPHRKISRRKDGGSARTGTQFWAGVVINAIRDAQGTIVGFAKITRDLTERRAAEERLHQSQKMEGIGQLTGGVAHDFNNLLTVIIGNLEALQRHLREDRPDSGQAAAVGRQRDAGRTARGITDAAASRFFAPAAARSRSRWTWAASSPACPICCAGLLGEQIAVETVLAGGLWRAHADPNQLEVAILNLAVNARDAMPNGGKLTIETANIHLDERYAAAQVEVLPGQYVMLAVTDNGTGMPADVKAKAFDPFFTTKDVGQGTGLGLSQVYGFVKQSRGHVKIYSEVGEGTTIKIYLPRVHSRS